MANSGDSRRKRVVAVVLDGLRRDFVTPEATPTLAELRKRATWFGSHRSVFPSCTRVVSSSFATGCLPSKHGLPGNTICLIDDGRLTLHDVGKPEFVDNKRRLTGKVLAQPTLAERLASSGGAVIFNNVSPGAAYMHDPDGYGHVYHRAGSFGPGRRPVQGDGELRVTPDSAGDKSAADRFATEVVRERKPSFALLWLAEPDTSQHRMPLGSPAHREVIKQADEQVRTVLAAVDSCRATGEEILFLVGSDHGHETVTRIIDITAELIGAGLKADTTSTDVMVAPNGTAALIYVDSRHSGRIPEVDRFLRSQSWAGEVFGPDSLDKIGLPSGGGLAFGIAMAANDGVNAYGVPGLSYAALPAGDKAEGIGFGQHGGLGRFEQSPFLIIEGPGFSAAEEITATTSAIDIAPTILRFLGHPAKNLDGRALQVN